MYRGMLVEAEDNMNCSLSNVTMTGRDGAISTLEQVRRVPLSTPPESAPLPPTVPIACSLMRCPPRQVFVRGGLVRYIILPDILKNAPMFKRIDPKVGILRGKGVGIGRSTMARAKRGGPEMGRGGPSGSGGGGRGIR